MPVIFFYGTNVPNETKEYVYCMCMHLAACMHLCAISGKGLVIFGHRGEEP